MTEDLINSGDITMNKILFLFTLFLTTTTIQADSDWRWSVTLGTGAIDYEEDQIYKDADGSDGGTANISDTYNPGIYGFGLSNGTHSFGYKITSAGGSDYDITSTPGAGQPASGYTTTFKERDYEETTLSYQYRLSTTWSVGLAYNDREHKVQRISSQTFPWDYGTPLEAGETADYTVTRELNRTNNIDGLALYATWVKQVSNEWYFSAKFGFAETSYDSPVILDTEFSGMPNWWNEYFLTNYGGAINGYGYKQTASESGDSSTAIVGFSFVRVFPNAPNHQLIINYDTRNDELGSSTNLLSDVGTGYFASDDDSQTLTEDLGTTLSEETNWKLTAEWKYTF
tara:strand:- start:1558 stop:2583 length:1026 start_codon:yes stop_codon:yes gene_type:complete